MTPTLIESNLIHLEAENRSAETIIGHHSCLGKVAQWLEDSDQSQNPDEWSANTIRAYCVASKREKKLNGRPLSAASVSTCARALQLAS